MARLHLRVRCSRSFFGQAPQFPLSFTTRPIAACGVAQNLAQASVRRVRFSKRSPRRYPVVIAEDMPDIAANSYSIAFGNFLLGYAIVDRMGVRVLRDPYPARAVDSNFASREISWSSLRHRA